MDGRPTLFDAIRIAQDLNGPDAPATRRAVISEYTRGQAELICKLFNLNPAVWRGEVEAEIRQEHGKYIDVREGGQMGKHGCEHGKCPTCGKCTVRSCPNRAKCRGHK